MHDADARMHTHAATRKSSEERCRGSIAGPLPQSKKGMEATAVSPDRRAAAGCAADGRLDAYLPAGCAADGRLDAFLEVSEYCGRREDSVSSDSSRSTDALLTSVPPPTATGLHNLTEFRSKVRAVHSDSDHEDFEGSSSSWSCDSVSGMIPTKHVRPLRGSLCRPPMPDWSPASLGAAAKAAPAASTALTDSSDSSCGPTRQSPIRRKRQSAGRRARPTEAISPRELAPATRVDLTSVEVVPCCLEFGHVVQWCQQVRKVSVHNPSRFAVQLHGGIITDGNQGAPFTLQLDNGWPTLPPMSTVVLQVCACNVGAV